jgi:catechol 2,3-dioxygenase-like lactoylglutathione lyase family enzyme
MNFNQVSMPTLDLNASIAFYRLLGLRLIVITPDYARFEVPEGDGTLSVYVRDELPPESAEGIHLYFECDDLDEQVARLVAAGVVFESEPEDMRWLWRESWVKDPAGNLICLYKAGSFRKNPPWRIVANDD